MSSPSVLQLDLVLFNHFYVACLRGDATVVPFKLSSHAVDEEDTLLVPGVARHCASWMLPDILSMMGRHRTPEEMCRVGPDFHIDNILILITGCNSWSTKESCLHLRLIPFCLFNQQDFLVPVAAPDTLRLSFKNYSNRELWWRILAHDAALVSQYDFWAHTQ